MEGHEARYLECDFGPGMFSNEYSVVVSVGNEVFSLFVNKEDVKPTDKGKGWLRVRLIDQSSGIVSLPSETLEQGRRLLRVPIQQIRDI